MLELFDLLMTTDLLSKAEQESKDEKLRRHPRVSRDAGAFAAAGKGLLEMAEVNPKIGTGVVWDLIENTSPAASCTPRQMPPPMKAEPLRCDEATRRAGRALPGYSDVGVPCADSRRHGCPSRT